MVLLDEEWLCFTVIHFVCFWALDGIVRGHSELPELVHSRFPSSVLTIDCGFSECVSTSLPWNVLELCAWSFESEVWVTAPGHLTFLRIL